MATIVNESSVYACFLDASKAFDLVRHDILFELLLSRGLPPLVVRLLHSWYRALARTYMWAWSIKRVANVWQNCIEVNEKAGPVVSTVLALPMPPWKRCSKFVEH